MTTSPDDMMRVLLLAREAGLVDLAATEPQSAIDVVPLFETLVGLGREMTRRRLRLAADQKAREIVAAGLGAGGNGVGRMARPTGNAHIDPVGETVLSEVGAPWKGRDRHVDVHRLRRRE